MRPPPRPHHHRRPDRGLRAVVGAGHRVDRLQLAPRVLTRHLGERIGGSRGIEQVTGDVSVETQSTEIHTHGGQRQKRFPAPVGDNLDG